MFYDRRLDGVVDAYLYEPKDAQMRINDRMRRCVGFLCAEERDEDTGANVLRYKGTGFFINVRLRKADGSDDERGAPSGSVFAILYLVTARHLIERARDGFETLQLQLNLFQGGVDRVFLPSEWLVSDDPAIDVAALRIPFPDTNRFEFRTISDDGCADDDYIAANAIGMGDDVFTIGLFTSHFHGQINEPIMRTGIIAAMPDEPWRDQATGLPYHAYLMESRSTGGLSGSPVFIILKHDGNPDRTTNFARIHLLGIVRSKWEYRVAHEEGALQFTREQLEDINLGLTQVTPIQEAIKLLYQKEEVKQRAAIVRRFLQEQGVKESNIDTP